MSSLFSFDDDSLSFYPELCTLPEDIDVAQYDCTLLGVTVPCSPNYTDKDIAVMGDQLELMHLFTFFATVSIGLTCLRGTVDSNGNFIWERSMAINSGFYAIFTGGFALFRWYFGVSRPLAVTGVLHNLFEWGIILHLTKIEKNENMTKEQILERRCLIVFCMQIILISLGIIIPSLKHGFAAVQVFGIVMDFAYPMLFIHKYFTLDDNDEKKLEELKKFYYYPALAHSIHLFLTILPLAMSIFLSLSPSWFTLVVVELSIHVSVPITHLIYAVWAWNCFDKQAWPKRDGDFDLPEKLTLPLRVVRRVFISCFVLAIIFFGCAPKVLGPCASALIHDNCEYREEYTVSSIANVQPGFQLAFKEWVTSQNIEKQAKGLQGNIDFEVMYDYGNQSRYQMISKWDSLGAYDNWKGLSVAWFESAEFQRMLVNGKMKSKGPFVSEPPSCALKGSSAASFAVKNQCDKVWTIIDDYHMCFWIPNCEYASTRKTKDAFPVTVNLEMNDGRILRAYRYSSNDVARVTYKITESDPLMGFSGTLSTTEGDKGMCNIHYDFVVPESGQVTVPQALGAFQKQIPYLENFLSGKTNRKIKLPGL